MLNILKQLFCIHILYIIMFRHLLLCLCWLNLASSCLWILAYNITGYDFQTPIRWYLIIIYCRYFFFSCQTAALCIYCRYIFFSCQTAALCIYCRYIFSFLSNCSFMAISNLTYITGFYVNFFSANLYRLCKLWEKNPFI
jgi:hypothetical protein